MTVSPVLPIVHRDFRVPSSRWDWCLVVRLHSNWASYWPNANLVMNGVLVLVERGRGSLSAGIPNLFNLTSDLGVCPRLPSRRRIQSPPGARFWGDVHLKIPRLLAGHDRTCVRLAGNSCFVWEITHNCGCRHASMGRIIPVIRTSASTRAFRTSFLVQVLIYASRDSALDVFINGASRDSWLDTSLVSASSANWPDTFSTSASRGYLTQH